VREVLFFASGEIVENRDLMTAPQQLIDKVRANKSGAAGHKITHSNPPWKLRAAQEIEQQARTNAEFGDAFRYA
jgi:hypothetical protein